MFDRFRASLRCGETASSVGLARVGGRVRKPVPRGAGPHAERPRNHARPPPSIPTWRRFAFASNDHRTPRCAAASSAVARNSTRPGTGSPSKGRLRPPAHGGLRLRQPMPGLHVRRRTKEMAFADRSATDMVTFGIVGGIARAICPIAPVDKTLASDVVLAAPKSPPRSPVAAIRATAGVRETPLLSTHWKILPTTFD